MERITDMTPIIRIETEKIENGSWLFADFGSNGGGELKVWDADLSQLTEGAHMFDQCNKLETFNGDLKLLTDANYMFMGCSALTSFSSDLSSLIDGSFMFFQCHALTTFDSDISTLQTGNLMFALRDGVGTKHLEFDPDLSSLQQGEDMFKNRYLNTYSIIRISQTIPSPESRPARIHIGSMTMTDYDTCKAYIRRMGDKGWEVSYDIIASSGTPSTQVN